ncbi:hypothetical protein DFH28DRAFT_1047085 [Melampsora americana]|nr:hypothetical protein DFH28DRAFT_1047085 [Melampsora americana]
MLATIDEEHFEPSILEHSTKYLWPGKRKNYPGDVKSIPEVTKGRPTLTPDDWKLFHDISGKVLGSYKSPELRELAYAVSKLGPRLDLHPRKNPHAEKIHAINLCIRSLENNSLNTAVKVWSIGVFSYLRSQISKYANPAIPATWRVKDLSRPRAEFLLFLLKDQDLAKFAQELWSKFPSEIEQSQHVLQEAIERESIVHLIEEIKKTSSRPSKSFKRIYLAFINLKTPIDSEEAMSLMALIKDHLDYPMRPRKQNGFHEEANTVRLLLHLEEHHHESSLEFAQLIKTHNIQAKICEMDISFQLSDEKLVPRVKNLLRDLYNNKDVNDHHIKEILEILSHENLSVSQLGRFFRALNSLFGRVPDTYNRLEQVMSLYPNMTPKIFEMLLKYHHGQMGPEWVSRHNLEHLILSTCKSRSLKDKYIHDLAEVLVSKQALSNEQIVRDPKNFHEPLGRGMVTYMLHGLFEKMFKGKSVSGQEHTTTDYLLVEYILHLISFKNNDKRLYHHLLTWMHGPDKSSLNHTPLFNNLSNIIFEFVQKRSWGNNCTLDAFNDVLQTLENALALEVWVFDGRYHFLPIPDL